MSESQNPKNEPFAQPRRRAQGYVSSFAEFLGGILLIVVLLTAIAAFGGAR
jgi:hypothetical protein